MKKNIGRIMLFLSCVAVVASTTTVYAWNNYNNEFVGDNICEQPGTQSALNVVSWLILILKMFIPLIIVVFGSIDMYKAVITGEADGMTKAAKSLGYRMVLGIFIFFLPTLVKTFIGYLLPEDYSTCAHCLFQPGTCKNGIVIPSANDNPEDNSQNATNNHTFPTRVSSSNQTSTTTSSQRIDDRIDNGYQRA